MKRLLVLTVVALLTASAVGCCRFPLGRYGMGWRLRGVPCATCETGTIYDGAIVTAPPSSLPPGLPGPVVDQ